MDQELAGAAQKLFEKQGLKFRLGARVQAVNVAKDKCTVECAGSEPVKCDRVLVAIGRIPNTDGIGLDTVGIELSRNREIPVGERFNTSAAGIHAIGDCIRGPKLAHKASHEGIACVEMLAGSHGHMNYDAIPGVVYTHPELASVGKTEEQLQQEGRAYRKGVFPFQASGRARSLGNTDGRVKVLADSQTDRLLGVHILGPRAGDLIAEAAAAIEFGASCGRSGLHLPCPSHPSRVPRRGRPERPSAGDPHPARQTPLVPNGLRRAVTLRWGSDAFLNVWHCLESDVVTNPQDHPRFKQCWSTVHNLSPHSHCGTWWSHSRIPSTKRFSTFVTLRLGSRVFERVALLGIGRGHQSARPSPIPSSVRRTYTICHRTRTAGRGGRILPDGGLIHHVQQCHTTAAFQRMR